MSIISTEKIFEAISYYKSLGYKLIDVPMCVDIDVINQTLPPNCIPFKHQDKAYVGSAEQSFIQLHKDKKIKNGKYMALTPCVRDEDIIDETHFTTFLKLELINIGTKNSISILRDAELFFKNYLKVEIKETNESINSFDINDCKNNIELGSYGIRKMIDGTFYSYGTGISEPRLSYVLKKQN